MCQGFAPKSRDKRTGCCITTHRLTLPFLTREFLTKNNMTVVQNPSQSSVSAPCDFYVFRHFDTIDLIEAELQAVLNTLTEDDFQDAF
jgi:hypothetical protein